MLVLDSNYQNAIQILRYNWDAFPLTPLATWGSSVTFDSSLQDITFGETLILDVINTDDAKIIDILSSVSDNQVVSEIEAGQIESDISLTEVSETIDESQI